jgi:transcriptional regulator with XRE-family HTH domain
MMNTRGERLRAARRRRFRSARGAALALGFPISTYGSHERAELPGGRDYGPEEGKEYGRHFGVSPEWLVMGIGPGPVSKTGSPPEGDALASPPKRAKGLPLLKHWRLYRENMTQSRLAERAGVTQRMISQLENGSSDYTGEVLESLADALRCEPADILARNPFDPDSPWWAVWKKLKPEQKTRAIRLVKALLETAA